MPTIKFSHAANSAPFIQLPEELTSRMKLFGGHTTEPRITLRYIPSSRTCHLWLNPNGTKLVRKNGIFQSSLSADKTLPKFGMVEIEVGQSLRNGEIEFELPETLPEPATRKVRKHTPVDKEQQAVQRALRAREELFRAVEALPEGRLLTDGGVLVIEYESDLQIEYKTVKLVKTETTETI